MTRIRTHIGVSVDGFISDPTGLPAWDAAPDWDQGSSYGYPEFSAPNRGVIIGRNTFDFGHMYWETEDQWPWEGQNVFVLTSRPLPERRPPLVVAPPGGAAGLVEHVRNAGLDGDVQLLGGAQAIRSVLELGAVDELGIVVLPILLGDGTPLWSPGLTPGRLRLERQQVFPDGAVHTVYTVSGE